MNDEKEKQNESQSNNEVDDYMPISDNERYYSGLLEDE